MISQSMARRKLSHNLNNFVDAKSIQVPID